MRTFLRALLLSFVLVSPAHAALSATEKAEIQELVESIRRLTYAWEFLGWTSEVKTTTSQAALNNLWAGLLPPTTDLTDAYAMLLHVNTAAPGDTTAYNAYEATARATLVSQAMTKLGSVATNLTTAFNLAETARLVGGQAASYYTLLATVKTHLAASSAALSGFNTALPYATPRGTPWFPRVVTPHGNFIESTRLLHAAQARMIESMALIRNVYNPADQGEANLPMTPTTCPSDNCAFRVYLQAASELIMKFTEVLHTWADIPIIGHCQMSPHTSMMRVMEKLTLFGSESASMTTPFRGGEHAGAPYRFHMAGTFKENFLEPLRAPMETRPLTWLKLNAGIAKYFESWQAQDGAMWEIMNFPAGVTLEQLRVQAGRTNVSNTPPLCPDVTPPVAALIYPANGQKVGGRLTVVAECADTLDDAAWGVAEKRTLCQKMDVKIDGATVATVNMPPYEYQWDTTLATNANHTVQAVGYDAAGNSTATSTATVTVGN